jgi:hypothetical protein
MDLAHAVKSQATLKGKSTPSQSLLGVDTLIPASGTTGPDQYRPALSEREFEMKLPKAFIKRTTQRFKKWQTKRQPSQLENRAPRNIGIPRDEIDDGVKSELRGTQHFDF